MSLDLSNAVPQRVTHVAALAVLAWITWNVWVYATSPLRKYPGPYLAGWTNLWRFYHVLGFNSHLVVADLHEKYGPVVRIGPNLLSLSDPSLVKTIYKFQDDWVKVFISDVDTELLIPRRITVTNLATQTEFYHGGSTRNATGKVIYNIFGISDRADHAQAISQFWTQLEARFVDGPNAGRACELENWFLYYAWDVVGDITFSQPFGYMKHGHDFDGTLADSKMAMNYLAIVGQIPILDFLGAQNPLLKLVANSPFTTANTIARDHLVSRLAGKDEWTHNPTNPDFLDGFIEAQRLYPEIVTPGQIQSYLLINLIAGADTTAITLSSVIYFSLKHAEVWTELEAEVLGAGLPDDRPVSYRESRTLPYLNAVVRESMRLHPAVGMPLERYVPEGGLRLPDGSLVPAGSMVGLNPYIINRTTKFGEDGAVFRPERWLRSPGESAQAYQERVSTMNDADLTFGAGSRICGGRHIANLEIYKVIATFVKRYRAELVEPGEDWVVKNGWFLRQTGVRVRLQRR